MFLFPVILESIGLHILFFQVSIYCIRQTLYLVLMIFILSAAKYNNILVKHLFLIGTPEPPRLFRQAQ
jgi:hypothetical protein